MRVAVGATFFVCLLGGVTRAQTGASLMVKPWSEKNEFLDARADAFVLNEGHIKDTGEGFQLQEYFTEGRARIFPGNEISPRVGWDFTFMDLHTSHPSLPSQLSDESIGFGTGLARWDKWVAALTIGVGYSGDSAFSRGDAWFGQADLIFARIISDTDALVFLIDYDGHRTFLPDSPLPGIAYSHRFDPTLQAILGLPYSSVDWKPFDRLEIEGEYALLTDFRANVAYEFIRHFFVYGALGNREESFSTDTLPKDRHLFFLQRRIEAGLRWEPTERLRVKVGVGYAFDGEFRSGWDLLETHRVAKLDDEPYVHAGLEFRF
jgi:hypothetical protein